MDRHSDAVPISSKLDKNGTAATTPRALFRVTTGTSSSPDFVSGVHGRERAQFLFFVFVNPYDCSCRVLPAVPLIPDTLRCHHHPVFFSRFGSCHRLPLSVENRTKKWTFDAGSRKEQGRWVALIKDVVRKAKDIEDGSIIIKEEEHEVHMCAAVVCAQL